MSAAETVARIAQGLQYAGGTYTVEDVLDEIEAGRMELWERPHATVVTQIQQQPRRKQLCLFLAAGSMEELRNLWPEIRAWAENHGCQSAYLVGRPGWARSWLKDNGWRVTNVVLETELCAEEKCAMT